MSSINGTGSQARKDVPLWSGVLKYFPDALVEIAKLSKWGNDKHNPGEPLHWSKGKSSDHDDCVARHLLDAGTTDPESGFPHRVGMAWRALAALQTEIEEARNTEPATFTSPTSGARLLERREGEKDRRKVNVGIWTRRETATGRRSTDVIRYESLPRQLAGAPK